MTTTEPPTRRQRQKEETTPAQALREAITPYITLPRLRRLVAEHGDLAQALRCPTPPQDVLAVLELLCAMLHPNPRDQIKSPTDAAGLLMLEMSALDQEHLRTVLLDTKNRVQAIITVYVGSVNTAMIRVGEVFKDALAWNSAALIVVHNHPSGDPTPSPEDVLITHQIVAAGKLLDIDVLDHLVIGQGRYCSMREKGPRLCSLIPIHQPEERNTVMEQSINRVELLGRTGNRPTLRRTPNDTPVTQFSLYTNQLWRNAGGELCEAAERHSVTAWGQLAIQCCNHLHKGSRVHITGRLQTRRWADPESGDMRLRTEIIASEVTFLGGIQQSTLPPAYGFELEDLPDIGGAEDETHAPEEQGLNDT